MLNWSIRSPDSVVSFLKQGKSQTTELGPDVAVTEEVDAASVIVSHDERLGAGKIDFEQVTLSHHDLIFVAPGAKPGSVEDEEFRFGKLISVLEGLEMNEGRSVGSRRRFVGFLGLEAHNPRQQRRHVGDAGPGEVRFAFQRTLNRTAPRREKSAQFEGTHFSFLSYSLDCFAGIKIPAGRQPGPG